MSVKSRYFMVTALLMLLAIARSNAQDIPGAVVFHIHSAHTSFPDTGRKNGHSYQNVLYTARAHYMDSSVLIIAPKDLDVKRKVDMIFWFHGWGNNVDSAALRYKLTKQFLDSKRNAVLILAETARNAPDSYGGKLETPGDFKELTADVMEGLEAKKIVPENCAAGHIILAGHSGAYRVIARIIKNGGLQIDEVMLFDALYGEADIFEQWIKADPSHRFIHLFTDNGGTFDESKKMSKVIDEDDINNFEVEETRLVPAQLDAHPIIFIHSLKEHNDIIDPDNFRLMLENTPFLKKLKGRRNVT